MEPISQWDADYVRTVVLPDVENVSLEKKASEKFALTTRDKLNGDSQAELAKQICGFANSGDGFIVYGITDDNELDAGVLNKVGGQSTKDWIEANAARLVYPPLTSIQAREIEIPGCHQLGHCVLAVSVPLSERRPHWVTEQRDLAYIRAGAHTQPMRMQSVLDIASRRGGSSAEISLRPMQSPSMHGGSYIFHVDLFVRLISGTMCEHWSLDVRAVGQLVKFTVQMSGPNSPVKAANKFGISVVTNDPLFAGRETRVPMGQMEVHWEKRKDADTDVGVEATLYLDSGFSVTRRFTLLDLDPDHAIVNSLLSR